MKIEFPLARSEEVFFLIIWADSIEVISWRDGLNREISDNSDMFSTNLIITFYNVYGPYTFFTNFILIFF